MRKRLTRIFISNTHDIFIIITNFLFCFIHLTFFRDTYLKTDMRTCWYYFVQYEIISFKINLFKLNYLFRLKYRVRSNADRTSRSGLKAMWYKHVISWTKLNIEKEGNFGSMHWSKNPFEAFLPGSTFIFNWWRCHTP